MDSSTTVIESQLDWLTVGTDGEEHTTSLRRMAERWVATEQEGGARVKPFRLLGNIGWQAGRVRFGQRDSHGLLQLSGDLAEQHVNALHLLADHVSRVDLAVTCHIPTAHNLYPELHYAQALARRQKDPTTALPKLVQDGNGGSTFYLGERTSNFFLRVYDKEAECRARQDSPGEDHYHGCTRYELEVKGPDAERWTRGLVVSAERSASVQRWVWEWCVNHGLELPFCRCRRGCADTWLPPAV